MKHLQDVLDKAHVCDGGRLQLIPNALPSIGLFHQNVLRCTKCFNETLLTNFQVIQPMKAEQQEPNKRLALAVATTGVGYRATKAIMYYDGLHNFAQQHFKTVINDIKSRKNDRQNIMNITVSITGTWKRRGHVSNYGIVYIIDVQSGLCIDYEVMALLCETCNFKKSKLSPSQFTKWYKKHQLFCHKNYDGTSKSMKKEGTVRLFQRSIVNGLRYTHMLCDGDASAFEAIKHYYVKQSQQQQVHLKSDTSTSKKEQSDLKHGEIEDLDVEEEQEEEYDAGVEEEQEEYDIGAEEKQKYQSVDSSNNLIVIKEDCINHVSKRVMKYLLEMKRQKTRLVSFSKEVSTSKKQLSKQQLLDDNKRWGGGPGRMTNNMMKKLSNGYGLAVRQASALAAGKEVNEALDIMQQFTRAAFYHYLKSC
ncbi:unnamed protein product [Rotaria sp. Silwood2]|nr:unnamed protein product [Rotaria sp. Silwood2]CAF3230974.1 unnamed protein product [Rotaria sp. Silwood2]CAF3507305.1 unnamed protein product [Rotaria sp. Silwood2]CAF4518025.1 unnamed protein product [Rotaria sp. Silwood2]CAF4588757.1 unnamed protein product [Rotaria sp. Silwood2]